MKQYAIKGVYAGVGAGLILFTLFGLLPGSFLGGIIGLQAATTLFGTLNGELIPRILVALFMVLGVMVSAMLFILGSGIVGYCVGVFIDNVTNYKILLDKKERNMVS